MKKVRMFLFLAAGLLALSACNEFHMKAPTGELSVVIVDDDVIATKASDTSERSYERKINDLQIFVFDDGTLFRYERIDRNLTSFPYTKSFGQIKSGTYTVWAVANADNLSDVTSEEELAETFIFLTDDSGIGLPHEEVTVGDYDVETLNECMIRVVCEYAGYHYEKPVSQVEPKPVENQQ